MTERAKFLDETRERIVRAAIAVHDEQGVAATSYVDISKRAGTGVATVYRHFPTMGSVVAACGAHVWDEMEPPTAEQAETAFEGLETREERLQHLVAELDRFYRRGAHRLAGAAADRHRIAELDVFLLAVETGVAAWIREAMKDAPLPEASFQLMLALTDFPVWTAMQKIKIGEADRNRLMARILDGAIHFAS